MKRFKRGRRTRGYYFQKEKTAHSVLVLFNCLTLFRNKSKRTKILITSSKGKMQAIITKNQPSIFGDFIDCHCEFSFNQSGISTELGSEEV